MWCKHWTVTMADAGGYQDKFYPQTFTGYMHDAFQHPLHQADASWQGTKIWSLVEIDTNS